jgi:hypothetical protein
MAAATAMVPVSIPADDPAPATHSGAPADAGVGQIGGGRSRVFDTASLLKECGETLAAARELLQPGTPEYERLHDAALRAAGVSSFRKCMVTGIPWQSNSIVNLAAGLDVVCVESCGGGKGLVMLAAAAVIGGLIIFVLGLSALESELMQRARDMGVEIVRVRGTAAAARDDDVAAASAGDAAVFAKMRKHKRTDPALVVVVQVSHHPSPASADTVCEHVYVCVRASGYVVDVVRGVSIQRLWGVLVNSGCRNIGVSFGHHKIHIVLSLRLTAPQPEVFGSPVFQRVLDDITAAQSGAVAAAGITPHHALTCLAADEVSKATQALVCTFFLSTFSLLHTHPLGTPSIASVFSHLLTYWTLAPRCIQQFHLIDDWAEFRHFYAILGERIKSLRARASLSFRRSGPGDRNVRVLLTSGTIASDGQLNRIRSVIGVRKNAFVHVTLSPIASHISLQLVKAPSMTGVEVSRLKEKVVQLIHSNALNVKSYNESTRVKRDTDLLSATASAREKLDRLESERRDVADIISQEPGAEVRNFTFFDTIITLLLLFVRFACRVSRARAAAAAHVS